MARPRQPHPTPAELEILNVLWERGRCTVREVLAELNRKPPQRAYTTVMSLLNVMADKALVKRYREGRAFVYSAAHSQQSVQSDLARDLIDRVYQGSSSGLVAHLLSQTKPDEQELKQIRKMIRDYEKQRGEGDG